MDFHTVRLRIDVGRRCLYADIKLHRSRAVITRETFRRCEHVLDVGSADCDGARTSYDMGSWDGGDWNQDVVIVGRWRTC
eukprot:3021269-Pyramimonas_sp.AAC.1